jgi:hypothetical protein
MDNSTLISRTKGGGQQPFLIEKAALPATRMGACCHLWQKNVSRSIKKVVRF